MARRTRGGGSKRTTQSGNKQGNKSTRVDRNNRADQLNPNNNTYWKARRYDERPNDWDKKGGKGKSK